MHKQSFVLPHASLLRHAARATFAVCALSLAAACGERTVDGPATSVEGATSTNVVRSDEAARTPTPLLRGLRTRLEFPPHAERGRPSGLIALDLDRDGRDELVALTFAPGTLQIWRGLSRTAQAAPSPRVVPIDDFSLGPIAYAHDGAWPKSTARCLVVASRATPSIELHDIDAVWRAAPEAMPAAIWRHALESRPRLICAGDLGLDQKLDLVVVTIDDDLILIRDQKEIVAQRLAHTQATCAAITRDGAALFIGFQGTRELVEYRYEAASPPRLVEHARVALEGLPRAIVELPAASSDADARRLCVAGGEDEIWIIDAADGALRRSAPSLTTAEVPIALALGSFGGNGTRALASVAMQGLRIQLDDVLGARHAPWSTYAGQQPCALALGDFDGDGRLDAALANRDAKRVSVLFGDVAPAGGPVSLIAPESIAVGRSPRSLAAGDLDRDGKPELMALNALEGTLSVVDGATHASRIELNTGSADALRTCDLDGDGHLDAAWLRNTDHDAVLEVAFGDGKGRLWKRAAFAPVAYGASTGDLAWIDVPGSNVPHALITDPEADRLAWIAFERTTEGDVRASAPVHLSLVGAPRACLALASNKEQGLRFAIALSAAGPRAGIALVHAARDQNGAWTLREEAHLPLEVGATALATADFDGDGRMDFAALCPTKAGVGRVVVRLQQADGAWRDGPTFDTGSRPYMLRAGDLDGDARADLVVSAQNSHHVNAFVTRATPALRFERLPDLGAGTGCLDVLLTDLDGDGRLELVVANMFSNDLSVIRTQ